MTKREKGKILIRFSRRLWEQPADKVYTKYEVEGMLRDVLIKLPGKKDINIDEDVIKDDLHEDIFSRLNCHEIDASEIHHGMTIIDSPEAETLTNDIIEIILRYNKKEK